LLPTELKLHVHIDPVHSFIEVSANIVEELGLTAKLSRQSYISPGAETFYLECDVDGHLLVDALSNHNIDFAFDETIHEELCMFRRYRTIGYLQ
tara:strand:+ start:76659 stop:76940 length:282 start_codon:yes stop_codon:yes gene_type:complete